VKPRSDSLFARKMWGTVRNNIKNLVAGVADGFSRNLEINGVGYRAQVQGKTLIIQLGFSHEVKFPIPDGITIQCEDQTKIAVSGADRQQVGQTAAEIRRFRPPEPYKGKGIRYQGEYVFRKEGKKK
jgi:large subunit ribosomal protein L6